MDKEKIEKELATIKKIGMTFESDMKSISNKLNKIKDNRIKASVASILVSFFVEGCLKAPDNISVLELIKHKILTQEFSNIEKIHNEIHDKYGGNDYIG